MTQRGPTRSADRPVFGAGLALAAGLALGVGTQVLQGILPGPLNWLANSLSTWLIAAFVAGALAHSPRRAGLAGAILLFAALAGYYAAVQARFGYGPNPRILLFWGIGALAGGLVFAPGGWWWRHGARRARVLAAGLLAALPVCEGIYFLLILPDPAVGGGAIVAGMLIPALLGRTMRERLLGYAAMLPWLALGALGYLATTVLYELLTGI